MQAICQNERVRAQRGEPLLLGAPPRVRNQIEKGRKPPSTIFNLHSKPKGGEPPNWDPLLWLIFKYLNFHGKEGAPPPGLATSSFL